MSIHSHLSHPKYRSDIDGLRAVAVISVVIFHAFPEWIKGGFIGVDIFFVISGFLISTIIFENLDKGTFSFSEFYARRVKRIFPALLLVLISVLVFGWFVLLADEYMQLGKHVASGAGFISNIILWGEAGYFDNSAETKPLLHLWSLGIEEQFYIVWPLLLWFAWKQKFNLVTIILLVASVSLYLNIANIQNDAVATFYSPQTRFWELLCGSLLAWISLYCKSEAVSSFKYKVDGWLAFVIYREKINADGKTLANFFSFAGVALLIYGFYRIDAEGFPGAWAIIPVLGAMLIIAGSGAWINRTILSTRIFVWFGVISYPLYLWHWPLFSFARVMENETPSVAIRIALVTLSIILAWLTYKFVESPVRFGTKNKFTVIVLVVLMALVGGAGYYIFKKDGLADRDAVVRVADINRDLKFELTRASGWLCDEPAFKKLTYCYYDNKKPSVVIIGDSHAPRIYSGLKALYEQKGESLGLFGGGGGCPPLLNVISKDNSGKDTRLCLDRTNKALLRILKEETIKEVILTSRGPLYTTGHGFGNFSGDKYTSWVIYLNGQQQGARTNSDVYEIALSKTVKAFLKAGKKVTYLYDVPELGFDIKSCAFTRPVSITSKVRNPCAVSKEEFVARNLEFRKMVQRVLSKHKGVRVVDLAEALCDDKWCYGGKDGVLYYTDDDHLSFRGASYVVEKLRDRF